MEHMFDLTFPIRLSIHDPDDFCCYSNQASKGFSFVITKEFRNSKQPFAPIEDPSTADSLVLTVKVLSGNATTVDMSYPAQKTGPFKFVIHELRFRPPIVNLNLTFTLKPKRRNLIHIVHELPIPYAILSKLDFGEYNPEGLVLSDRRFQKGSHILYGNWLLGKDIYGKILYQFVIPAQPGVLMEDSNQDYHWALAESAGSSLPEKLTINFLIDLDVISDNKKRKSADEAEPTEPKKPAMFPEKPLFYIVPNDMKHLPGTQKLLNSSSKIKKMYDEFGDSEVERYLSVDYDSSTVEAILKTLEWNSEALKGHELKALDFCNEYGIEGLKALCCDSLKALGISDNGEHNG